MNNINININKRQYTKSQEPKDMPFYLTLPQNNQIILVYTAQFIIHAQPPSLHHRSHI